MFFRVDRLGIITLTMKCACSSTQNNFHVYKTRNTTTEKFNKQVRTRPLIHNQHYMSASKRIPLNYKHRGTTVFLKKGKNIEN